LLFIDVAQNRSG